MEEKKWKLYKHTTPNGKVYIGITSQKNINRRWKNGYGYSRHPYFNKAIEEFGWNNIKHEVLFENLSKEEADLLEQMYISLYDSNNKELFNLKDNIKLQVLENLSDSYGVVLFLVSYALVGFEVILAALKNIFRGEIFDENLNGLDYHNF